MLRTFKVLFLAAFTISGSLSGAQAFAEGMSPAKGNPEAGAAKAAVCSACHGQNGEAIMSSYPNLAGQHYDYLLTQMRYFKEGKRKATLMMGQVDNLSDDDLKDIAAYFSAKPKVEGTAQGGDLKHGESIYRGGLADKGVPACAACHSPRGLGNGPAGFPLISGQHADYIANQLKNYRSGERMYDGTQNQMMRGVAGNLSDADIEAVSAYIHGLH